MSIMSSFISKLYSKWPIFLYDLAAVPVAWFGAYLLRYNLHPFSIHLFTQESWSALFIFSLIQVSTYYYFKVYRGLWRFSSIQDLTRIIQSVSFATLLAIPALYQMSLLQFVPRSVLPLYAIMVITLQCMGRLLARLHFDAQKRAAQDAPGQRVLVIGAGAAGESLLRDLKRSKQYHVVGLLDDDTSTHHKEIHGVGVLGAIKDIGKIVKKQSVELVFIAIPSARSSDMRNIVAYCEKAKIPFRTLPTLTTLASGKIEINALRDVNIEDLLGRDPVHLEWNKIADTIRGKRVIVTGGGGSIGSELCRQIMRLVPAELLVLDSSEFNLYTIEQELSAQFADIPLKIALLSVTDRAGIDQSFKEFKPHLVFHAAAYKHVPMLEAQLRTAVLNNVIGTQIVAEASVAVKAQKFILISTDKAVNPTNIMGTTKRIAEMFCQNFNERVDTQFVTVRFGNVLGSAGSVVPLFKKQLNEGGPLTVTHPDIERFFMTIPEASQLILQAMCNGLGGEIFVLDMGEPIKIRYLAEQVIKLSGKTLGKDIDIIYTGLRPGEKLFEELFHESEMLEQTTHEKLFKARVRRIEWNELHETMRLLNHACCNHHEDELRILLQSLVPEFKSSAITVDLFVPSQV